jgi:DNA-binding beta-propeller fold protein YncE
MRRSSSLFAGLLLAASCSGVTPIGTGGDWQISHRVTLDEGAALAPDDASKPGEANPQSLAVSGGRVYAALTNLFQFAPAGPSWISVHDAATLERVANIRLQTEQAKCTNAGSVRAFGDRLYVSCAGRISQNVNEPSEDGWLFELALPSGTIERTTPLGRSPGAVLVSGSDIWLSDLETPTLMRMNTSGTILNGAGGESAHPICERGFASDLAVVNGRGFATCFNDDTVQPFDLATGHKVGAPLTVGDGPIRLATISGMLLVLNSLDGTLTRIATEGQPGVQAPAIRLAGEQGGNDSEGLAGDESWAAVTNAGVGTLVILDVKQGFQLVDAVDLKASPDAPTNSPYGVATDGEAFFVAIAGWQAPVSEIIRVARR